MPTGYTAGIIDGTIKTFEDYAKQCVRNFGAAMHMRDEPFDVPYQERKPSSYHLEKIGEIERKLAELQAMSDDDLLTTEKAELINERERIKKQISERQQTREVLYLFLAEAIDYKAPTEEHQGIRDFMIQQLQETIKFDGSTDFYHKQLKEVDKALTKMTAVLIRIEKEESLTRDLEYHRKEHQREIESCDKCNQWVKEFFNSLDNLKKLNKQ